MFGKITKYSAPNCPFTKLSCFLISVPCLILDNSFIFIAWNLSQQLAGHQHSTVLANAASALRAFQHWLKMQSLDSSEMLKGVKRLTPISTGQFDQAEKSQATCNNQNIPTNAISMHCGLLLINDYIIISKSYRNWNSTLTVEMGRYRLFEIDTISIFLLPKYRRYRYIGNIDILSK